MRQRLGDGYPFPKSELPKLLMYLAGPSQGFSWKFTRRNAGYPLYYDNTRSRTELGIDYHAVEDTVVEHVEQLIAARAEA